ncbi:hypothetical protein [Fervidibacillus albus]|uniref:Uncharacterized protein n=1 Tax=Fervidibacillus albus TaxID=2980026 RepID=A0A9E8LVZ3_9BACI|nr:hypothetical protein [Fervidibacillus albus]WAA10340.1 hypothetical protein OE104_03120 [Fervidibacillus albus]
MGDQWYSNKDLFEMVSSMKDDFQELRAEMRETRNAIKKYNGLREELGETRKELFRMKDKVEEMEAVEKGKDKFGEAVRDWGGWIFALISLIILLINNL